MLCGTFYNVRQKGFVLRQAILCKLHCICVICLQCFIGTYGICSSFFFQSVRAVELNFKHCRLILYLTALNCSSYLYLATNLVE